MLLTDEERETLIDTMRMLHQASQTAALRRYWWSMLQNLIDGRSTAQKERMQRAA